MVVVVEVLRGTPRPGIAILRLERLSLLSGSLYIHLLTRLLISFFMFH